MNDQANWLYKALNNKLLLALVFFLAAGVVIISTGISMNNGLVAYNSNKVILYFLFGIALILCLVGVNAIKLSPASAPA